MKKRRIIVVRYDDNSELYLARCGKLEVSSERLKGAVALCAHRLKKQVWDCSVKIPACEDMFRNGKQ